jgi:IS605 OrfB family transposase
MGPARPVSDKDVMTDGNPKTEVPKTPSEIRGPTVYVSTDDPAADAALIRQVMAYRHFTNLQLLVRDELWRGAEPEKYLAHWQESEDWRRKNKDGYEPKDPPLVNCDPASKARHKELLKLFGHPLAVRSLFQARKPEAAKKREATRLANLAAKNPEKHAKVLASKAAWAEKTGLSAGDEAALLRSGCAAVPFFAELLAAGSALKSHVIYLVAKRVETQYVAAFDRFKETGRFTPPRPEALDRVSQFFVDLDEKSARRGEEPDSLFVNLDRAGVKITVPLTDVEEYAGRQVLKGVKIGVVHGRLAMVLPYLRPRKLVDLNRPAKYAGLDLGVIRMASLFVDDDLTANVCVETLDLVSWNARFNEDTTELQERYVMLSGELKKLRGRGKTYVAHEQMMATDVGYRAKAEDFAALKAERQRRWRYRRDYVNDYLHKLAVRVGEYLAAADVTKLFVSRNLGELKVEGSRMRRDERRKFHQLPIVRLVDFLELNAWKYGFEVERVDEAYTSKANCMTTAVLAAHEELRAARGRNENENEEKPKAERERFAYPKLDGTALCGRRQGGRYIPRGEGFDGGRAYWHADTNGAANHIIVGLGHGLEWTKRRCDKLFATRVVKGRRILDQKNGLASLGMVRRCGLSSLASSA